MSTTVGVIVCNHSRARLFKADAHSLTQELSDQVNPAARLRDQDLATDAPGRYRGGGTNGQQHTEDPRTAPREKAAEHFARDIAAAIEQAIAEHKLQKLYLIAEPNMLGLVRKETLWPRWCVFGPRRFGRHRGRLRAATLIWHTAVAASDGLRCPRGGVRPRRNDDQAARA